jgi:hypothetical protein
MSAQKVDLKEAIDRLVPLEKENQPDLLQFHIDIAKAILEENTGRLEARYNNEREVPSDIIPFIP